MECIYDQDFDLGHLLEKIDQLLNNHTTAYENKVKSVFKEKDLLVKRNQQLTAQNSHLVGARNELENLFLECADEVRKDIARRRHVQQVKYNKNDSGNNHNDKMTQSDKRKLLENLVYNEKFLKFVYENMFPKKVEDEQKTDYQKLYEFDINENTRNNNTSSENQLM